MRGNCWRIADAYFLPGFLPGIGFFFIGFMIGFQIKKPLLRRQRMATACTSPQMRGALSKHVAVECGSGPDKAKSRLYCYSGLYLVTPIHRLLPLGTNPIGRLTDWLGARESAFSATLCRNYKHESGFYVPIILRIIRRTVVVRLIYGA